VFGFTTALDCDGRLGRPAVTLVLLIRLSGKTLMADRQDKHILGNGLVLLGEPMEAVGSAAFGFILPVGAGVQRHQ
jgi:hypothetical protein